MHYSPAMHTFKKNERLANHRLQSLLFCEGNHFFTYPFRVQWICLSKERAEAYVPADKKINSRHFDYPAKCLIGASKRQLKKAVHRNRAKRLTKEAYRKNKSAFYAFLNTKDFVVLLALIYSASKLLPHDAVEKSLQNVLQRLIRNICDSDSGAK